MNTIGVRFHLEQNFTRAEARVSDYQRWSPRFIQVGVKVFVGIEVKGTCKTLPVFAYTVEKTYNRISSLYGNQGLRNFQFRSWFAGTMGGESARVP